MTEPSGRDFAGADAARLADLLAEGLDARGRSETGANHTTDARPAVQKGEDSARDAGATAEIPGYTLLEEIHRGGQGVVYRAVQRSTKREVAIKVLREGPIATRAEQLRFRREGELLGQLRHRHIVAIHDSGTVAGCFYLVMEYIPGQPLDAWLADRDRPLTQRLELFACICDAVGAAHLRGIIHPDQKPRNIPVTVVLDFGLAKLTAADGDATRGMTVTGQFMGSLPWASPEQARGASDQIDLRTDVYSLGVILYQVLTGRFPYDVAGSVGEVLDRIAAAAPPRPSTFSVAAGPDTGRIDDEIETIVLKCLQKDPERRYQSAGELARDIRRHLAGEPIEARRDSLAYVLGKRLRRYRVAVAVATAFVVVLLVGLVTSVSLYRREQATAAVLRQRDYIQKIARAQAAWEEGRPRVMKDLLYSCTAELRGWEWCHLVALSDQSVRRLRGHTGWIASAALTADGRRLITASRDRTIRVWDLETGRPMWTETLSEATDGVALSPDQGQVASVTHEGVVQVWTVEDGELVRALAPPTQGGRCIAFSPDGRWLVCGEDAGAVTIWDAYTWQVHDHFDTSQEAIESLTFAPDGRQVVFASEMGPLCVRPLSGGQESAFRSEVGGRSVTAFSPDGRWAALQRADGLLGVYDAANGAARWPRGTAVPRLRCMAFSPDGRRLATGGQDSVLRVWDAATGELLRTLWGHEYPVRFVAFLPSGDGTQLVSAGEDATIRLWDVTSPPVRSSLPSLRGPAAFLPDGRRLVCHAPPNQMVTHDLVEAAVSAPSWPCPEMPSAVAVSPDGRWVAGLGPEYCALHDAQTGALKHCFPHPGYVALGFSPDGDQFAFAMDNNCVGVFNPATASSVATLDVGGLTPLALAFSPDGRWLAVGDSGARVRLWDRAAGVWARTLEGHTQDVRSLAFSSDGALLATGGNDCTIRIWDVATGETVHRLVGHEYDVHSLAITPDGRRLLSGSYGSAKLWDVRTGTEIHSFQVGPAEQVGIDISPDGRRVALATRGEVTVLAATDEAVFRADPESAFLLARTALSLAARGEREPAEVLFQEALDIFRNVLRGKEEARVLEAAQAIEQLLGQFRDLPPSAPFHAWRACLEELGAGQGAPRASAEWSSHQSAVTVASTASRTD